ncbi:MAG: DUF1501 domain-containing protein [Pirellulaceae bacterium]|jgi:hypothetical protein|nr:DUF1501 domain-containing protein [Pirellulaceae bacterium]MDP7014501.1 DUF1501 domain-containing protein [Pirellulaceae bacterium]
MNHQGCGHPSHINRRTLIKAAAGAAWLTPVAELLARDEEAKSPAKRKTPAKAVIMLWLQGGPSQLETFDPHSGTKIAGGTTSIETSAKGVQLAAGLEQLADEMHDVALVRSVVSKEGDHERATYNVKTGYRPVPALRHPAIGAAICNKIDETLEIPRHVSILPGQWPARGGFLGDQYDAFKMGDPADPIPDVKSPVKSPRFKRRLGNLDVLEAEFARGRFARLDLSKTLHRASIEAAEAMMSADQLTAFNVKEEPKSVLDAFGDSRFGRGCLAALRLIDVGVRCVEITLNGWDTHADNHAEQGERIKVLDPAMAALIRELRKREMLDSTIVVCCGEFGRTPTINPFDGRDHWPHGFSVALFGGGIRGGAVVGATAPNPKLDKENPLRDVENPRDVADIHATILHQLGIDFEEELSSPIGRPMAISAGKIIEEIV